MKRTLIVSNDGSFTFRSDDFNETYHSLSGAIDESVHVYIKNGLIAYSGNSANKGDLINVLELGLGTGLNVLLTFKEKIKNPIFKEKKIFYEAVELFPLRDDEWKRLNYSQLLSNEECYDLPEIFAKIHEARFDTETELSKDFIFIKRKEDIVLYKPSRTFDVIFFDAFSPDTQPELWSYEIFSKIASAMHEGSVMSTYSSKGTVKRTLRSLGLNVTRVPGIGGKRHILKITR